MSKIGLFDIFQPHKEPDKRNNHTFTDEDRETSTETWKLKQELKRTEMKLEAEKRQITLRADIEEARQRLADLTEPDDGEEEPAGDGGLDAALMAIAMKILQPKPQETQLSPTAPIENSIPPLSDSELSVLWDNLPDAYKKAARKMKDAELEKYIRMQKPQATPQDIAMAIEFVRHN